MLHDNAGQRPAYKLTLKRDKERDDVWKFGLQHWKPQRKLLQEYSVRRHIWDLGCHTECLRIRIAALKAKTSQGRPCDYAIHFQIAFSDTDLVLDLIWNDPWWVVESWACDRFPKTTKMKDPRDEHNAARNIWGFGLQSWRPKQVKNLATMRSSSNPFSSRKILCWKPCLGRFPDGFWSSGHREVSSKQQKCMIPKNTL